MKQTLHIISHSHWDREWYISFEEHRMRLVELLDSIIEKMEECEDYKYFHLDGQTIVIDDYLEIRPEMHDRLYALIKAGRIHIGPWYILQDEYLTSGEANVRNMIEGLTFCRENGIEPVMSGYMPDAFGNISQLPQILAGFGIDNAIFGRGTSVVLADNKALESESSATKELIWHGADDSTVIGVMFTNWYDNANELPTDKAGAKKKYGDLIKKTSDVSVTGELLGMNGCDHQPLQRDLPESIKLANELFGDTVEIRHSNFKDFIALMRGHTDKFAHVYGELNSQKTSGECLLIDTASTHVPLKQKNHKGQNMLAQRTEPLSAIAADLGDTYRKDMIRYSWKKLMQCHPHDSICCCSCDDVTREMSTRFDKSYKAAEYVLGEAGRYAASAVDTSALSDNSIIVFHSSPKKTANIVRTDVYLENYMEADSLAVFSAEGKAIPCAIEYKGLKFTYTLPKDSFRKVKYKHCYSVSFPATFDGIGCFAYYVAKGKRVNPICFRVRDNSAENEYVSLVVGENGAITVTDKASGRTYKDLNVYEDSGDRGNSYNYIQTDDKRLVFPKGDAEIRIIEDNGFTVTYEIKQHMDIPEGLTDDKMRTVNTIGHTVVTRVTLNCNSPLVEIEAEIDNKCENHRFRALFTSDIKTTTVFADGQFDVLKRDITPWEGWKNPSNTQRMQAFFGVEDADNGILVATRGLCEYEVLRDGRNTLALTLFRSTGEVGDWGIFPTPDMQLKQKIVVKYGVIPYTAENKAFSFDTAYAFAGDFVSCFETGKHKGSVAPNTSFIKVKGDYSVFSTLKASEDGNGTILRIYNVSEQAADIEIELNDMLYTKAFETNLAENLDVALEVNGGKVNITAGPKKIKTIRVK